MEFRHRRPPKDHISAIAAMLALCYTPSPTLPGTVSERSVLCSTRSHCAQCLARTDDPRFPSHGSSGDGFAVCNTCRTPIARMVVKMSCLGDARDCYSDYSLLTAKMCSSARYCLWVSHECLKCPPFHTSSHRISLNPRTSNTPTRLTVPLQIIASLPAWRENSCTIPASSLNLSLVDISHSNPLRDTQLDISSHHQDQLSGVTRRQSDINHARLWGRTPTRFLFRSGKLVMAIPASCDRHIGSRRRRRSSSRVY